MNFKISIMLRFFCCLIFLASSINSLENDDNSGEEKTHNQASKNEKSSSIKDQLKRFSVELRQFKERDDLLTVEVEKINEALNELKSTVDEIKLQVNESDAVYDRHLSQLSDEINSFKKGNEKLKIEVNAINEVLRKNETLEYPGIPFIDFHKCKKSFNMAENELPAFTFLVNDLKKKMDQNQSFVINSEVFPLTGYAIKARAKLYYESEKMLWCFLSYKNSNESSDYTLKYKILPAIKYVFKNQNNENILIKENFPRFNWIYNYEKHFSDHILIPTPYEVRQTAAIDIYVETPEQTLRSCSDDGTFTWLVRDVSEKREARVPPWLWHASPYFYSGPKGYRMIVGIEFLNNYTTPEGHFRNGLNAFTFVINGFYDDNLRRYWRINTTFTLFHPHDPAENKVKTTAVDNNDDIGEANIYVAYEELESMLVDDSLYYQVNTQLIESLF